jgi:cyclic pyranopterin phosphate synthase
VLRDSFARVHDDLRISVTDRCNLRCTYCMPAEPVWLPRESILRYEEIDRIARIAVGLGVRKIRLTGGEPLVRRDLPDLVRRLAGIEGLDDLSLTTNGLLLESAAPALRAAGLSRINVSLDTLDPRRFERMTRRDALERVLAGISAASAAGLVPIKVNTVVLRGMNDDEIESLVERARNEAWELRFIEFMPLENDATWDRSRVVTGSEIRARIASRWPIAPDAGQDPHAPATRFRFADGRGAVGFIDSVTAPFCSSCSRLRLTADGHLRVCLYDDDETDLRTPLRAGSTDPEIAALVRAALARKGAGGALELLGRDRGAPLARTMHQIGG